MIEQVTTRLLLTLTWNLGLWLGFTVFFSYLHNGYTKRSRIFTTSIASLYISMRKILATSDYDLSWYDQITVNFDLEPRVMVGLTVFFTYLHKDYIKLSRFYTTSIASMYIPMSKILATSDYDWTRYDQITVNPDLEPRVMVEVNSLFLVSS